MGIILNFTTTSSSELLYWFLYARKSYHNNPLLVWGENGILKITHKEGTTTSINALNEKMKLIGSEDPINANDIHREIATRNQAYLASVSNLYYQFLKVNQLKHSEHVVLLSNYTHSSIS